ncbi:MAG: PolC-type DNA polymerase III N-terminal domain-containing protein [Lachnospira eligens]
MTAAEYLLNMERLLRRFQKRNFLIHSGMNLIIGMSDTYVQIFEVFKTLKLPEDLAVYFENVEVTKVSKTSTNSLYAYIKSSGVIETNNIQG